MQNMQICLYMPLSSIYARKLDSFKLYDNEYTLIIDIYFYESFSTLQPSSACTPKHFETPCLTFWISVYASL